MNYTAKSTSLFFSLKTWEQDSIQSTQISYDVCAEENSRHKISIHSTHVSVPVAATVIPQMDSFGLLLHLRTCYVALSTSELYSTWVVVVGPEIFECVAKPASASRQNFKKFCDFDDHLTGRIPLKLLYFIGMPIMITHRLNDTTLHDVVANGTIGHIIARVVMCTSEYQVSVLEWILANHMSCGCLAVFCAKHPKFEILGETHNTWHCQNLLDFWIFVSHNPIGAATGIAEPLDPITCHYFCVDSAESDLVQFVSDDWA